MEIMKTLFVGSQSVPDVRKTTSLKFPIRHFCREKKRKKDYLCKYLLKTRNPLHSNSSHQYSFSTNFQWLSSLNFFFLKRKKIPQSDNSVCPRICCFVLRKNNEAAFLSGTHFQLKFFLFVCLVSALSNSKLKLSNLIHLSSQNNACLLQILHYFDSKMTARLWRL